MAREFARVKLDIWNDDEFRSLSPAAQHLYFILLTSPSLTYCGTTDWRPARLSGLSQGWSTEDVQAAAYILAERRYVVIDETTEEALIRSFIRHDGLMTKPRMAVSMVNAHRAVSSLTIRGVIVHELNRLHQESPELSGWLDVKGGPGAALGLLDRDAVDPREVASDLWSVCPSVCTAFATNAHSRLQRVCTPTTPTPTPAPADNQTATAESDDSGATEGDGPEGFEEFWDVYDHKVDKINSKAKYAKALKKRGVTPDLLIECARAYIAYEQNNEGGRYVMGPAKWLLNERWLDERKDMQNNVRQIRAEVYLTADQIDELGDPPDDEAGNQAWWERRRRMVSGE